MAEGGVLVEGHLGVERVHLALGREDQRVDLGQVAVALDIAVIEADQQGGCLVPRLGVEVGPVHPLTGLLFGDAGHRIDVDPGDGIGVGLRHLLDLDPALGGQHAEVQLCLAVEREAGVVLLGDVGRVLHPQPLHHVALDVEPEDVAGVQPDLVGVGGQLHPTRLAATTHLHLGLDHDGVSRGLGLLDRLVDRVGHPARGGGDAKAGEVLLALVLVQVHLGAVSLCLARRRGGGVGEAGAAGTAVRPRAPPRAGRGPRTTRSRSSRAAPPA